MRSMWFLSPVRWEAFKRSEEDQFKTLLSEVIKTCPCPLLARKVV